MAIIYPEEPLYFASQAEKDVFKSLKENLSDDYYIFYSLTYMGLRQKLNGNKKTAVLKHGWGECDFVLFHPKIGGLVVEVKGGDISFYGRNIVQKNTVSGKTKIIYPYAQAEDGKYYMVDYIKNVFKNKKINGCCKVEPIVWFPNMNDNITLPGNIRKEYTFTKEAIVNPQKYIDEVVMYYNRADEGVVNNLDKVAFKAIINEFAPTFNRKVGIAAAKERLDNAFLLLTEEQSSIIDLLYHENIVAINGQAGTGKTMLALYKAKQLSEELETNFNGDYKVLFLCYNKFLREYLLSIKKNNVKEYKNVDIHNIYTLYEAIIGTNFFTAHGRKTPEEQLQILRDFLLNYQSYKNWNYYDIIIDEGQDIDIDMLETLYCISQTDSTGHFYYFYDDNQKVNKNKVDTERVQGLLSTGIRLKLRNNCRNTQEIANTCGAVINVPATSLRCINGQRPNFYMLKTIAEAKEKIESIVKKYTAPNTYSPNQICIMSMCGTNGFLYKEFSQAGCKIAGHGVSEVISDNEILLTTSAKFKGLEADIVIIIDCVVTNFTTVEGRQNLYVGASRARQILEIEALGGAAELEQIADAVCEIHEKSRDKSMKAVRIITQEMRINVEVK